MVEEKSGHAGISTFNKWVFDRAGWKTDELSLIKF